MIFYLSIFKCIFCLCVFLCIEIFYIWGLVHLIYNTTDTAKCQCEFVECKGKLKQHTRTGSSPLLLPRNNTRHHGIGLVLLWNVKVLRNSLKLVIALTVVSFSTSILPFWPWICYEAWSLVTKMSWNHLVDSSLD